MAPGPPAPASAEVGTRELEADQEAPSPPCPRQDTLLSTLCSREPSRLRPGRRSLSKKALLPSRRGPPSELCVRPPPFLTGPSRIAGRCCSESAARVCGKRTGPASSDDRASDGSGRTVGGRGRAGGGPGPRVAVPRWCCGGCIRRRIPQYPVPPSESVLRVDPACQLPSRPPRERPGRRRRYSNLHTAAPDRPAKTPPHLRWVGGRVVAPPARAQAVNRSPQVGRPTYGGRAAAPPVIAHLLSRRTAEVQIPRRRREYTCRNTHSRTSRSISRTFSRGRLSHRLRRTAAAVPQPYYTG